MRFPDDLRMPTGYLRYNTSVDTREKIFDMSKTLPISYGLLRLSEYDGELFPYIAGLFPIRHGLLRVVDP